MYSAPFIYIFISVEHSECLTTDVANFTKKTYIALARR